MCVNAGCVDCQRFSLLETCSVHTSRGEGADTDQKALACFPTTILASFDGASLALSSKGRYDANVMIGSCFLCCAVPPPRRLCKTQEAFPVIGCNSKLFFHKLRAKRSPLLTKLCLRRPDIVAIDTLRTELGGGGVVRF